MLTPLVMFEGISFCPTFTLPKLCISEKLLYFCRQTNSLTTMRTKRRTPLILKFLLLPLFLILDAVEQLMRT